MKEIILKIPAFSKIPEPAPLSPLVYDLYTSGIQGEHMQKVNIGLKEKLSQTNPSSKWIDNLNYSVSLMGLKRLYMCRRRKVWSKSVTVPAPGSYKHTFFLRSHTFSQQKTICSKGLTL